MTRPPASRSTSRTSPPTRPSRRRPSWRRTGSSAEACAPSGRTRRRSSARSTTPSARRRATYSSGTAFTLTNLFPFVNGYTFYSGGCTGNDPSKAIPTYFTTYPAGKVVLAPGTIGTPIDIAEPSVSITVKRSGSGGQRPGVGVSRQHARAARTCGSSSATAAADGTIQYDGLPFGNYTLCAYQLSNLRRATANVNVNATSGIPAQTLDARERREVRRDGPDSTP